MHLVIPCDRIEKSDVGSFLTFWSQENNVMKDIFRLPHGHPEHTKNSSLLQIIVVIGSGILSSSALATVAKAWLDNRKTRLTIQIDGKRKTLTYEGHHLNQDAATIQNVLSVLGNESAVARSVDVVTINLADDGQKEAYVLAAGDRQENTAHDDREQAVPLQQPSLLRRLLPDWLRKEPPTIGDEQSA